MRTKQEGLILFGVIFIILLSFSSSFAATITYTYDNLNRLTKATYENGVTEEFTYDAAGNRLTNIARSVATATPSPATNVTSNLATLNGTVNPNGLATSYYFEWGTTTSYGNTTSSQSAGSNWNAVGIYANLNGLIPNTTYHFRLVATNSAGTAYGSDMSFTTSTVSPSVTTSPATTVTTTSATLNGTVNANNASTTVTFQYGLTTAYGSTVTADQDPVTGTSDTAVSKAISGLTPNTTYHYRVVGVNAGGTTNGGDLTFMTSPAADTTPPVLSITSHSNGQHVTTANITLIGTASDVGKGESGIQEVTVNGIRGNNDTATGSGTANWSKAVALNPGANTLTVVAYDNSTNHNSTTVTLTIYYDAAQAPSVTTGAAANVTQHSATLKGTVNPNGLSTTYYFEWGTTTSYGNKSPATPASAGSGWGNTDVSANLTGLTLNTNYHYRLVATNSKGTTYGSDMTFRASINPMPWLMLLMGD